MENKFCLWDLAIAGLKILEQLEALKFVNILCFWQKQLCFYQILKTSCVFSTMSENIFSELRTSDDRPSDIKSEVQLRYYIVIRSFYYMIYIWKQPSDSESEIRLELSDLFFYMNGK